MYALIFQNRIMGCHGTGSIPHNPNRFFLLDKSHLLKLVPVNNSVLMKNCPGSGVKVGLISRRPYIDIVFFTWIAIFYPIIVSNHTIKCYFLVAISNCC